MDRPDQHQFDRSDDRGLFLLGQALPQAWHPHGAFVDHTRAFALPVSGGDHRPGGSGGPAGRYGGYLPGRVGPDLFR